MSTPILTISTRRMCMFLALLMSMIAFTTFAQESETPPVAERPEVQTPPTQARGAERTSTLRTALARHSQERILNLISNVITRLDAGIARMTNIILRLNSRIEKQKALGIDTASAETKLAEAQQTLSIARTTLESQGSLVQAITSDTPRERYRVLREQFLVVQYNLRATNALLADTVILLKGGVPIIVTPETQSSSTPTTATTSPTDGVTQ